MRGSVKENRKAGTGRAGFKTDLLNMAVIADMLFTVTVIPFAAGTIPEFQFRVADIGSSTDGTPVGVRGFRGCLGSFIGSGIELDDLRFFLGLLSELTLCVDSPGHRQHIHYIFAEEQKVVCQRNNREEVVRERIGNQIQYHNGKVKQGENPCLHRNDEEQQKLCIREQGCIAQEQTQVQIGDTGIPAEEHAVNIHQNDPGEIEQVKPESAPDGFYGPANGIVTEQGDCHQQQIVNPIRQRIGKEPPDLSPEDQSPVKIEKVVQQIIAPHFAHDVNQSGTQGNVQHQIGNAFISVFVAEKLKLPARIFQKSQLLK